MGLVKSLLIIHDEYSKYLKKSIEVNSRNNHIYLIGNKSVNVFSNNKNVEFIDLQKYTSSNKFSNIQKKFIKYGDKSFQWHYFNLIRMMVYKDFMEEYKISEVFSCDSDNILLDNINKYPFSKKNALCIPTLWDEFYHASSIHSGLISIDFAQKYEILYDDIFINRSKFNLVEEKINYHKTHRGGLTDMTLYHIMISTGIVEAQNLLEPILIDDEKCIFINNFSNGEGPKSQNQYKLRKGKIQIKKQDGKNYVYDEIEKTTLRTFNIHFQGTAKKDLNWRLSQKIVY